MNKTPGVFTRPAARLFISAKLKTPKYGTSRTPAVSITRRISVSGPAVWWLTTMICSTTLLAVERRDSMDRFNRSGDREQITAVKVVRDASLRVDVNAVRMAGAVGE
jgi:hypothetical protein